MDIFTEKSFYPNYEEPILNHFKGFYDSVFIAFSPFFQLKENPNKNPSFQKSHQISYEQLKSEVKEFADIPEFKAKIYSKENKNYPDDETIIEYGEIITWKEIKEKANFEDFGEIHQALKTSIGSYRQIFEKIDLQEKLKAFTDKEKIFHPTEGNFEPLIKVKIYNSLKQARKNKILVVDEYELTEKKLDLISPNEFIKEVGFKDYYIYSDNKDILFTIDWDSFFFLICSNQPLINEVIQAGNFEGFFCTNTTKHNWEYGEDELSKLLELEKEMENK